jgi:hypothetical protein
MWELYFFDDYCMRYMKNVDLIYLSILPSDPKKKIYTIMLILMMFSCYQTTWNRTVSYGTIKQKFMKDKLERIERQNN